MTSTGGDRLRVALSASPALLSDCLRTLLADVADVTVILDEPATAASYDVAIVTPTAPQVPAEITIVLDEARTTRGGGTVRRAGDRCAEHLVDLAAVIDYVGAVAAATSPSDGHDILEPGRTGPQER